MHEYLSNVEIDGARADDDQFWRIQRIHRVIGYAQALADLDGNEKFTEKISRIYDYKGMLSVEWKVTPTEAEKIYLQKAWDSIVSNYESGFIDHI